MNAVDVSIIIVNYKSGALLSKCLTSLYEHCGGLSFDVIVYDNASDDGGLIEVAAAFPDVRFIYDKENLGYARANNQAIAAIGRGLYNLTEPVYRPIRRFLPDMGGVDLSPLVVLVILYFLQMMLNTTIAPALL